MTRIAESRLETIHLLEQELEKQAVDAATAAAAFAAAQSGPDYPGNNGLRNGHRIPGGSFMLPTIVYAGLLGSVILAMVVYRIYRIVQVETRDHKRTIQSHTSGHHHRHNQLHRNDSTSSLLPLGPSSPTNSSSVSVGIGRDDDDDDDVLLGIAGGATSMVGSGAMQGSSALTGGDRANEPALQQCYKRSQPPLSPVNRLMHV